MCVSVGCDGCGCGVQGPHAQPPRCQGKIQEEQGRRYSPHDIAYHYIVYRRNGRRDRSHCRLSQPEVVTAPYVFACLLVMFVWIIERVCPSVSLLVHASTAKHKVIHHSTSTSKYLKRLHVCQDDQEHTALLLSEAQSEMTPLYHSVWQENLTLSIFYVNVYCVCLLSLRKVRRPSMWWRRCPTRASSRSSGYVRR